ncbi:MAG: Bacterial dnaA protein helix-turn-helix [Bacteroidota bacterium]|jgi:chromosomal replication initiation ATPase DnaA
MQKVEGTPNVLVELPTGKRIMLRMSIVVVDANDAVPLSEVPSLGEIAKLVCTQAELTVDVIRSEKRTNEVLTARMLISAIATEYDYSSKQIGKYFNRDHSTVLNALKVFNDLLSSNDDMLLNLVEKLQPLVPFTIKPIKRKNAL